MNRFFTTLTLYNTTVRLLIFLILIFISFPDCFCQENENNEFPVLSKVYEVNKEPSDYIIVIDRSGTVRRFWNPIKASVNQVIDLANEGDYVSFIGFNESVDNLIIPRTISSANKQATKNEINSLSEPTGNRTDLFESVDFTLERGINRPNGNKIQLVFYFTDFINHPPSNSKWRNNSTDELVTKRTNYIDKSGKLVNVFAFQLPLEAGAGRDFEEFSHIFDNRVKRIISDLNAMQNWFGRLSQEIAREKLRLLLQNDLDDFLLINALIIKGNKIEMEVSNTMEFPVTINQVDFESKGSGLRKKQLFKDAIIPAKGTTKLTIPISDYLERHKSFLEKTIGIENPDVTLHFSFDQLANELAILNIPNEQERSISADNNLLVKTGLPYWIAGVIALLIFLLGYFINKIWIKPEWIFNRKSFKVIVSMDGKLLNHSSKVFQSTRKTVLIDNSIINPVDIPTEKESLVAGIKFMIFLDPAKPRFLSKNPKRGTYMAAECASGRFRIRKSEKGKETFTDLPKNRGLFSEQVFLHKGIKVTGEFSSGITRTKLDLNFLPLQ